MLQTTLGLPPRAEAESQQLWRPVPAPRRDNLLHTPAKAWLRGPGSQCLLKQPVWSGAEKGQSPRSLCSFQMDGLGLQGKQCPLSTLPSCSQGSIGMGMVFLNFSCDASESLLMLLKVWVWLTAKSVT